VQGTGTRVAKSGQLDRHSLDRLRELPIADIAPSLGIEMRRGKAMCFNGHDRQSPSFTICRDKTTWKCYGCGEYGDAISLVEKVLGLDFKGACRWLCDQFAISSHSTPAKTTPLQRLPSKTTKSLTIAKPALAEPDPAIYSWLVAHCGPVTDPRGTDYLINHGVEFRRKLTHLEQ
jgi:DNA primase